MLTNECSLAHMRTDTLASLYKGRQFFIHISLTEIQQTSER